jgi:hypothetical protein
MKDQYGHGSNAGHVAGAGFTTPEGAHSQGINNAVGAGGDVSFAKHPKSTPVPLHPNAQPPAGCDLIYRDGQFLRIDKGSGAACVIAGGGGKTLAEVTTAKVGGGGEAS